VSPEQIKSDVAAGHRAVRRLTVWLAAFAAAATAIFGGLAAVDRTASGDSGVSSGSGTVTPSNDDNGFADATAPGFSSGGGVSVSGGS
jgi:hypothetical protein